MRLCACSVTHLKTSVGTALDGPTGGPAIVLGPSEASEAYGSEGTIPAVIAAVYAQGWVPAIAVINALDPTTHVTASAAFTFDAAGSLQLAHERVSAVVVTDDQIGTTTYVEDTDYTQDAQAGTLQHIAAGAIGAGATVYVAIQLGRHLEGRQRGAGPGGRPASHRQPAAGAPAGARRWSGMEADPPTPSPSSSNPTAWCGRPRSTWTRV